MGSPPMSVQARSVTRTKRARRERARPEPLPRPPHLSAPQPLAVGIGHLHVVRQAAQLGAQTALPSALASRQRPPPAAQVEAQRQRRRRRHRPHAHGARPSAQAHKERVDHHRAGAGEDGLEGVGHRLDVADDLPAERHPQALSRGPIRPEVHPVLVRCHALGDHVGQHVLLPGGHARPHRRIGGVEDAPADDRHPAPLPRLPRPERGHQHALAQGVQGCAAGQVLQHHRRSRRRAAGPTRPTAAGEEHAPQGHALGWRTQPTRARCRHRPGCGTGRRSTGARRRRRRRPRRHPSPIFAEPRRPNASAEVIAHLRLSFAPTAPVRMTSPGPNASVRPEMSGLCLHRVGVRTNRKRARIEADAAPALRRHREMRLATTREKRHLFQEANWCQGPGSCDGQVARKGASRRKPPRGHQ